MSDNVSCIGERQLSQHHKVFQMGIRMSDSTVYVLIYGYYFKQLNLYIILCVIGMYRISGMFEYQAMYWDIP